MGEQTLISVVAVIFIGAFFVGVSVADPKKRLNIALVVGLICLLYGWMNSGSMRAGIVMGIYLFVGLFFLPYSFGASIGRRFGKRPPPSDGSLDSGG